MGLDAAERARLAEGIEVLARVVRAAGRIPANRPGEHERGTAPHGSSAPGQPGSAPPRRTELVVWLALTIALVGLLQAGAPPRVTVLSLIVVAATLAASLRWRLGAAAVLILLAVGVALRLAPLPKAATSSS